jgi:Mn2+/Fe2+ NRAMP family transporter
MSRPEDSAAVFRWYRRVSDGRTAVVDRDEAERVPNGQERRHTVTPTSWEAVTGRPHRGLAAVRTLGPGSVAGASDIDPTTVATMAVIRATTIYALTWRTWLLLPIVTIELVTGDPGLMGDRAARGPLRVAGWVVTTIVTVLGLVHLVQQVRGGG